jgi:hypothetical protein
MNNNENNNKVRAFSVNEDRSKRGCKSEENSPVKKRQKDLDKMLCQVNIVNNQNSLNSIDDINNSISKTNIKENDKTSGIAKTRKQSL